MHRGKIILILSCMFSGKTETLITYARRYQFAKKNVVLVKYSKDVRYAQDEKIYSHNRNSISATFSCESLTNLMTEDRIKNSDVILIDEIQFFPDAPQVCDKLANDGKIVIIAGLNGNYKREEFPVISKLIPLVEEIKMMSSVCTICSEDAHFTKRIISSEDIEIIGGIETYQPMCRSCFEN